MTLAEDVEKGLVKALNDSKDYDIDIEKYAKFNLSLYSKDTFKGMIKACKIFNVGKIDDFVEKKEYDERAFYTDSLSTLSKLGKINKVAISEKLNTVLVFTKFDNRYDCLFMVNSDYLSEFNKKVKYLVKKETTNNNIFKGVDFRCNKGEYIELSEPMEKNERYYNEPVPIANINKKKLHDEHLIYTDDSILTSVMKDIALFFKDSTKTMYKNMNIPHKRGIILHGDPGNGKSALIRETIRRTPNIAKIVFNPGMKRFTNVLSLLVEALDGEPAIVILEDMDSIIDQRNRAEFLNILDGINMISGVFFIGTTNYIERIDPAFVNRSGRFDRVYTIGNPDAAIRREFFRECNIGTLLSGCEMYTKSKSSKIGTRHIVLSPEGNVMMNSTTSKYNRIIDIFTKYSDGMSMAALKEFITATSYTLAENKQLSIEDAVKKTYDLLVTSKENHVKANKSFESSPERKFSKMMNFMDNF